MKRILILITIAFSSLAVAAQTTLIAYGASSWKYLDNGTNQGSSWYGTGFNDNSWKTGTASFGYGTGILPVTTVSFGSSTKKKYITTYFRKTVSISNLSTYGSFTLYLKRDDGAAVYVNGVKVYVNNLPATFSYSTKASSEISAFSTPVSTILPTTWFVNGTNVIAVEVHQASASGPDIFFDLSLVADPVANQIPTANAGADQSITLPTSGVTLSGSGTDADGTISSYAWSKVSGPVAGTISAPTSATTNITGLTLSGTYSYQLTVTDNSGATANDTVQVVVNPIPNQFPTANAGADQSITLPTSSVTLSGSGTDADGTISSYAWSKVSGPAAGTISAPTSATTNITGLTLSGTYSYQLTVTDNSGATAKDTVQVVVSPAVNQSPVANAGADQSITLPTSSVTLSGSGTDADGTISSYAWSQVSGPVSATINASGSSTSLVTGLGTAGTYVFELAVTDDKGATGSDQVSITVDAALPSTLSLVNWGATWKYLDNGTDQGTAWRQTSFNDASWTSGAAELGYGDGDETTVIGYGSNSNAKYITSYFRKVINFSDPSSYALIYLNVKRDDGIIVYINGTEVYRNNMPAGTVTYSTLASTAVSDDGESIFSTTLQPGVFVSGDNTVAVEIHQNSGSSSDISFDLELTAKSASSAAALIRGPYLQMVSGSSATLRWRTDLPVDSKVEVGTVKGTYPVSVADPVVTTEHEVRLTGLTPNTRYYYRFGSSSNILQDSASNYFVTAPPADVNRKLRIAVFGDCGRNDNTYQTSTLSAYLNYVGANPAELMLLLGDNAYNSGTDAEYQSNFFNVYSSNILKNHALFPAPGNHDYANTAARQIDKNVPYYSNFTMPKNAECGGVASGTESYYSYDWGNIHFLSLDSYGMETGSNLRLYDTTGPQVTWIKQDLALNTKKWTVAYWHHPPYTMGSHNSDTEQELINMRQNFIRILERYGVDLVLCGHSHDYERSYLLKGYYAGEASFNVATHAINSSSGRYDGSNNSCAYKTVSGPVNHGTVYVVSGSAGASGGVQAGYPHNALPFAINDGGMFYFEVDDNRLDAKFIQRTGTVYDQFTILKDVGQTSTINTATGQAVTLTASWKGTYSWSTGATTRSITVSPTVTTAYTCTDGVNACVSDQFTVNVTSLIGTQHTAALSSEAADGARFTAAPVPVHQGDPLYITVSQGNGMELSVINMAGQKVMQTRIQGTGIIYTQGLKPGVYVIRSSELGHRNFRKIVITAR